MASSRAVGGRIDPSLDGASAPCQELIVCGDMVLDPAGFSLTVNGRDVPLTYLEVILLTELMRRPYAIVRYERLLGLLWSAPNRPPTRTSLAALRRDVGRLRAKLRALGKPCIRTMQGVGYGFVPSPEGIASRSS